MEFDSQDEVDKIAPKEIRPTISKLQSINYLSENKDIVSLQLMHERVVCEQARSQWFLKIKE